MLRCAHAVQLVSGGLFQVGCACFLCWGKGEWKEKDCHFSGLSAASDMVPIGGEGGKTVQGGEHSTRKTLHRGAL